MVGSGFLKKPVIPAVCAGLVASVAFYVFYGLHIPRVFALIVFAFCVAAAFFAKDKRLQRLLVWSAVGLVLAFAALARLEAFVKTEALLPFQQIASITAELTGEPKPSLKYFSVDCVLKEVQDSRGSRFSASGNAKIFLPKAVVEQNLSGGISLVKAKRIFSQSGEDSAEGAVCTVFASGATVNLRAKYSQSEGGVACFFAENELPAFLGWHSPIARFRGTLRFQVMRLLFSWGAAGALLLALISADKNFLAPAVSTAFTDCGLAHVLALSGMHVSIVSGASEKLFKPFAGKKATGFISLAAIAVFVWFAGAAPSLNRALGMAAILITARLLGVRVSVLSALCGMFLLHLTVKPQEAITLGFMLSYGALAGILLFGEALSRIGEGKIPQAVLSSFSASFGAQAFTLPLIVFTLKRITLIGLLSSSIVSPLISWFLVLGLAALFVAGIIPQAAPLLGAILNRLYDGIMLPVNWLSGKLSFDTSDLFTAILWTVTAIALGVLCLYFQKDISQRRMKLGNFNL